MAGMFDAEAAMKVPRRTKANPNMGRVWTHTFAVCRNCQGTLILGVSPSWTHKATGNLSCGEA